MSLGPVGRNTTRSLRQGNRSLLLRALYAAGEASRQDLGEATGLSGGTVSTLVAELISEGLVTEIGTRESDGGRPHVLLSIEPSYGHIVGVDVGETRIRLELFDMRLSAVAKAEHVCEVHDPDLVVASIAEGLTTLLADADVPADQVLGVGVGVPGVVNKRLVVDAPTCQWKAVPLAAMLSARTDLPLYIENGAKAFGQAELWFGNGRGAQHLIVALLGTGVGAAIVSDGSLYRGASSSAGEWGHTVVERDGRRCRCGGRGCLEAYVGAGAIIGRYLSRVADDDAFAGLDEESGLAALLARAETGDTTARQVLTETADWLGLAMATMINLFNPERFLLGGWAGRLLGGALLDDVRAAAAHRTLASPFSQVTIGLGALGPDAVALGAATLVVDDFLDHGPPARSTR